MKSEGLLLTKSSHHDHDQLALYIHQQGKYIYILTYACRWTARRAVDAPSPRATYTDKISRDVCSQSQLLGTEQNNGVKYAQRVRLIIIL